MSGIEATAEKYLDVKRRDHASLTNLTHVQHNLIPWTHKHIRIKLTAADSNS